MPNREFGSPAPVVSGSEKYVPCHTGSRVARSYFHIARHVAPELRVRSTATMSGRTQRAPGTASKSEAAMTAVAVSVFASMAAAVFGGCCRSVAQCGVFEFVAELGS